MGGFFAVGATGFVIGPLSAYASGVGAHGDALTFFVSSILFTGGGLTQSWLAHPERREHRSGRLAWRAAWIQSVGTLLFNVMTLEAISRSVSAPRYDLYVWVPNAVGSACFLISGALLYLSAPREGWRPLRRADGWWEPPVNLLGCVLFGVSAIAGYAAPRSGQLLSTATSNWTTTFGAACFFAIGAAPLILGMTFKIPRLSRLVAFERALQRDITVVDAELEADAREATRLTEATEHDVRRIAREGEQELAQASSRRRPSRAETPERRTVPEVSEEPGRRPR